jgi:hypothetical protein
MSSKYSSAGRKATWAIQIHPPPIENGCYSFTQEMGLLPNEIVRLLKLHQKTGGKKK